LSHPAFEKISVSMSVVLLTSRRVHVVSNLLVTSCTELIDLSRKDSWPVIRSIPESLGRLRCANVDLRSTVDDPLNPSIIFLERPIGDVEDFVTSPILRYRRIDLSSDDVNVVRGPRCCLRRRCRSAHRSDRLRDRQHMPPSESCVLVREL
jgi:hypothetical protein